METHNQRSKYVLIASVVILISATATTLVKTAWRAAGSQQEQQPVTSKATLPVLISKVKKLKIVNATVKKEGEQGAKVTIEIKNTSDLAVTYFALTNGSLKTSEYGIARNGLDDPDNPHVVIEPHGTATIDILLSNLDGQYPIVLSAAVYADNSEDGDESVLEHMRIERARDKAKRDAERGVKP